MKPGVVPLELVIARNERVAVRVTRLAAYPTGFEFELRALSAPGHEDLDLDPMLSGRPVTVFAAAAWRRGVAGGDAAVRVQFADGTKATNTTGFHHGDDPPPAPVMGAAARAIPRAGAAPYPRAEPVIRTIFPTNELVMAKLCLD